jgi:hypothetical protein
LIIRRRFTAADDQLGNFIIENRESTMPIITIIIVLVVIGLVLYLIENYIPMSPPIKTVLRVVVILGLCIWLLNAFGIVNIPMRIK